jgi:potassium efflux system protein
LHNSLAIFSQYAIILLGVLIGLNLLNINLTSLTVFAGALGVGIGLGLQNIANNFVSGLILLMERPVRILDWVTISNHEGKVSRIGMRFLTVTTWDNQDVIIPNADLISTPFTNWTLSDALVRTIFVVGSRIHIGPSRSSWTRWPCSRRSPWNAGRGCCWWSSIPRRWTSVWSSIPMSVSSLDWK